MFFKWVESGPALIFQNLPAVLQISYPTFNMCCVLSFQKQNEYNKNDSDEKTVKKASDHSDVDVCASSAIQHSSKVMSCFFCKPLYTILFRSKQLYSIEHEKTMPVPLSIRFLNLIFYYEAALQHVHVFTCGCLTLTSAQCLNWTRPSQLSTLDMTDHCKSICPS